MSVESVTVYPSDFGLEKMAEETVNGPPRDIWIQTAREVEKDGNPFTDSGEDEEGSDGHEKSKKQKHNLRYAFFVFIF